MSETTNSDLAEAMRRLETRLDVVARPYEDAMADRLFSQARDRLYKYMGLALVILLPALSYAGYHSWKDITEEAKKTITLNAREELGRVVSAAKLDAEKKIAELGNFTSSTSNTQERADLKTLCLLETLGSKFETQLVTLRKQADQQTLLLVEEINKRIEGNGPAAAKVPFEKIKMPQKREAAPAEPISPDGWVYYGSRVNGKWKDQNFTNLNSKHGERPVEGDEVKANTRMNVRTEKMSYENGTGWQMAPVKALLEMGTTVTVRDVEPNEGPSLTYYWVRFDDPSEALCAPDSTPRATAQ